ncbi:MAG: branched-chain amino acid ABC transporter permease [Actinobacteria bacterium]|nr:branched-chain amino acid ABC transporter permease [Actinomycetota bacterium]MBU1494130.1 branched-chain amino acid ABC transporter permease [Actinomycetota bacterium]MBU1865509.1 branched-chain amino acid ABC transporter permease [Actinomycetota bacterium]
MSTLLQAVLNGLALAAVYALIALGFVIIYKSMQVLSFAQPALMLFGGYFVVYFSSRLGLNFYLAVLLAIMVAGLSGLVIERSFLRPMVGKPVFAVAIMTIGIDLVVRIITGNLFGVESGGIGATGDPWGLGLFIGDPAFGATFHWGDVVLNQRRFAAIVAALLVIGILLAFFRYSRIGLAMRATAFDQEVALTQGVSVSSVFALSWAIAAALATVAALFISPNTGTIDVNMFAFALKALPVVVIGGMDSIGGALLAALIVGLAESLTITYQPVYAGFLGGSFSQVVPYLVMFVVLLVRPYGLFGTREVERV